MGRRAMMGGGCTNGVKQSGLSLVVMTCSGGNRVLVSHSVQQIIEVTGKHQ